MKKFNLSSVVFMWIGFAAAIIATLCMFFPFISINGGRTMGAAIFWNGDHVSTGVWSLFIGFMLILIAGIALGVLALPFVQISEGFEKKALISIISALSIGFILALVSGFILKASNPSEVFEWYYHAGFYICEVLTLGTIACGAVALELDC